MPYNMGPSDFWITWFRLDLFQNIIYLISLDFCSMKHSAIMRYRRRMVLISSGILLYIIMLTTMLGKTSGPELTNGDVSLFSI